MSVQAILLPVFALVALTFFTLLRTAMTRVSALKAGEVKLRDIALGQSAWPTNVQQISNSYENLMQLPALFYALTIFAMLTKKADLLFVIMAWLFVATRYAHALIHQTSNNVPRRFQAFSAGVVLLVAMWVIFAVRILAFA
ncbi:MAG: MAPEG family protein [Hyphomicrobiales bacterium]|nr:MAPEG family protein [Hyphomicrobiales bacterium]